MGLIEYLRILRRRWLTILVVLLVCVGVSAVLTARATPQYTSSSRVFISTPESDSTQAYSGNLFSQSRVKSYADLVPGEEFARRIVRELNLDESPRTLARQITAFARLDTVVLTISVTDPDPQRAQLLTQTAAEVFVTYVKELETPEGKTSAPVKASIVDRATRPIDPVSPQPTRNIVLAIVLGSLLGVAAAAVRDLLDQSITTSEELAQRTDAAPLLGHIYYDRAASKSPLIDGLEPHAARSEAYRVLRTNLQFVDLSASNSMYVVTSAVQAEGKTTTAINLSLSLAEAGSRVMLLEGDMRRPKASVYLGLESAVGLTTVLLGRVSLDEAIQRLPGGVDVLTAGRIPPNPTDLLQTTEMQNLLSNLRAAYDIVIVDAPPLLPVADAAILAASSDGALFVVRHGKTTRGQVAAGFQRLRSVDAHAVGTIFAMTPPARRGHDRYGYGYGYAPEPSPAAHAHSAGHHSNSRDWRGSRFRRQPGPDASQTPGTSTSRPPT